MRSLLVSVAALLAVLQPIQAKTNYGCWSEQSAIFHEHCLAAVSTIITKFSIGPNARDALMPANLETVTRGNCRVQIKAKSARRVYIPDLLTSFNVLISRCQNGYFYYDDGWFNANVQGHAGWKRDTVGDAANDTDVDFPHGGLSEWELSEEISSVPALDAAASVADSNHFKRQNARDLVVPRAGPSPPTGSMINKLSSRGSIYTLTRTIHRTMTGLTATAPQLIRFFEDRARDLISDALTITDGSVQVSSIAHNNGHNSQAIAVSARMNHGIAQNWQQLFNRWGDGGYAASELLIIALQDYYHQGFTTALYTIWNDRTGELVSFTLNRVVGTTNALPRNT